MAKKDANIVYIKTTILQNKHKTSYVYLYVCINIYTYIVCVCERERERYMFASYYKNTEGHMWWITT